MKVGICIHPSIFTQKSRILGLSGVFCDVLVLLISFIKIVIFSCGIIYGEEEQLAKILLWNGLEQPGVLLCFCFCLYYQLALT